MIFGEASTFSKMPCNYPECYPKSLTAGHGNYVYTSDTKYFDTISALGAKITGYCNGEILSLPSEIELVLFNRIKQLIPFVEMVRYGSNGADATEGAIRYARAHTGKEIILSYGYHSCQSAFTFNTPPALGCIDGGVRQFDNLNDLIDALSMHHNNVAGVIVEPFILDPADVRGPLIKLRELTAEYKIVLIFDEIITGFRVPNYTVSTWFNIIPDLILFGKGLGDGFPLSVIGGSKAIMNRPVFISYTFAGLPYSLQNALDTIYLLNDKFIMDFWNKAGEFKYQFNQCFYPVKLKGYNTRGVWTGDKEMVYLFWQEMLKDGILLGPAFFPKYTWTSDDYDMLLKASKNSFLRIKNGAKLKGNMPHPIFERPQ